MKKILLIVSFLLVMDNVHALTFYSDYSKPSTWSTKEAKEDELTKVNKEVRYKWYNEEKIYGGYEDNSEFPLLDYDDYKTEEYCTSEPREASIERIVYFYKDPEPLRYVYINNSNDLLSFNTLEIYSGNMPISYQVYSCDKCINNEIGNFFKVDAGGEVIIDLNGYYPPWSLTFKIKTSNTSNYDISLTQDLNRYIQYAYSVNIDNLEISYNDFRKVKPLYYREYKSYIDVSNNEGRIVRRDKEYCSIIYHYRHYKTIRHYSSNYMKEGTAKYPIADLDDYKTYYQVMTRNYLSIPDNIIITDKTIDLESLIKSDLPFKVITDLNKDINGVYQFTVDSPVMKVIDNVTVDIKDNDKILELENLIKDKDKQILENAKVMEELLLEIASLKNLNAYLDKEKILMEATKKMEISNYIKEINRLNNIPKTLEETSNIEEEEEADTNNNYLYYLGIGLIITGVGLSFILVIKKNN